MKATGWLAGWLGWGRGEGCHVRLTVVKTLESRHTAKRGLQQLLRKSRHVTEGKTPTCIPVDKMGLRGTFLGSSQAERVPSTHGSPTGEALARLTFPLSTQCQVRVFLLAWRNYDRCGSNYGTTGRRRVGPQRDKGVDHQRSRRSVLHRLRHHRQLQKAQVGWATWPVIVTHG